MNGYCYKYKLCVKCVNFIEKECILGIQGYRQYFATATKKGITTPDPEPIIAGIVACGAFYE